VLPPLVQEGDCSPFFLDSYATENKNSTRKVDTPSMRPMSSLGNGSEFYKPPPLKKMIPMTKTADRQTNHMANPILCMFHLSKIRNILISKVRG